MPKLEELGWNSFFAAQLGADDATGTKIPGRVIEEQKRYYRIACERGEVWAEPVGKLTHAASTRAELPAVGDWVIVSMAPGAEKASIERVLDRKTKLSRKAAGDAEREQVIAANIDVVFIVTSLNQELNLARLERYLTVVQSSGARPVILLTKADLCTDVAARRAEVEAMAAGAPVHTLSVPQSQGLEAFAQHLAPGTTAAFVGSSGVGKSTLINALARTALQPIAEARAQDDRGRHTTTYRRLIQLEHGMVIDTPGMREIQAWLDQEKDPDVEFQDVLTLAAACRFTNCSHQSEPGCALKAAVERGELEARRFDKFLKLAAEAAAAAKRRYKPGR